MPPITRSVVRRRNWRWSPGNEHTPGGWVCFPGPGTAVADFDTFDDAEAEWGKRESAVRLKLNPFDCGPLPMVSSLPDPILRDFLMDTGIEPPAPGIAWDAWWLANREQLSDEQRARVWEATDKVRFFEITEEAIEPEIVLVVDVTWEAREGIHVADWDGGELIRACRHPERAGVIAHDRSRQRRLTPLRPTRHLGLGSYTPFDEAAFADCRPSSVPDLFTPGSTRLTNFRQASFCEVRKIPFDDTGDQLGIPSGRVSVVMRRDLAPGPEMFRAPSTEAGVPVKAFADWERAKAWEYAAELESEARAWFNPLSMARSLELLSNLGDTDLFTVERRFGEICRAGAIPECRGSEVERWWAEHIATLPEAKRKTFWTVLDRVQFYFVVSVEFEG